MVNLNRPEYIEVQSVYELNAQLKEGYEFVCPVLRSHISSQSQYANLQGNAMGSTFNLNGNLGDQQVSSQSTWYLMRLTEAAKVLYGKE